VGTKRTVRKMTNTTVTHVSLVENPANEESFLMMKSSGENIVNIVVKGEDIVRKSADEEASATTKQVVYGIVYSPDKIDADNEFMSAEDIEKAAHGFLANFRNVDGNHDFVSKCGEPVESSILVQDTEYGERVVKKGSWVLAVKCTDSAWESVQKGEFRGFSLAGKTVRKEVEVEIDAEGNVVKNSGVKLAVSTILEKLGFVKKDFAKEVENSENNNLYYYLELLWAAVSNARWSQDTPEEMKAEIDSSLAQFSEKINGMTFVYKAKEEEKSKSENTDKGEEPMENSSIEVKTMLEALTKSVGELTAKIETLEKSNAELSETAKKSTEVLGAVVKRVATVEKSAIQSGQKVDETVAVEKPTTKTKKFNALLGGYNG